MSTSPLFAVSTSRYCERYFAKGYSKGYGKAWILTFQAIFRLLENVDKLLGTKKLEIIHSCREGHRHIVKGEFSIAGTNVSAHASGNRFILFLDLESREVRLLLIYGKNDIVGAHETLWWQNEIKAYHSELVSFFPGLD